MSNGLAKRLGIPVACIAVLAVVIFLVWKAAPPSSIAPLPANPPDTAVSPPNPRTPASAPPPKTAPQLPTRSIGKVQTPDGGSDPALFGNLVALGQGITLAETLAKNADDADAYVEKLCEEARKLRENLPLPDKPGTEHDAAPFMAPLVDYEPPLENPPGRLHLRADLADRLRAYGPDWPVRITDADLAGLDFRWLIELGQFDHWSLLGAGRLRELPPGNLFHDAIPDYTHLMFWAKLRYALAFRRGDLQAAVGEVRHLAMLVRTQGILIAERAAIAMTRFEALAHDAAVKSGVDVAWWSAPVPGQIDAQRNASTASTYFAYPGVREATLLKAAGCAPSPCTMLIEGATANRAFGAYGATNNWSLVASLVDRYGCESGLLERIRQSHELAAPEVFEGMRDALSDQIAKNLGPLN